MSRRYALAVTTAALLVAGVLAGLQIDSALANHNPAQEAEKGLFGERWYHSVGATPYVELSTSPLRNDCDGDPVACGAKWNAPVAGGIIDWNLQDTTVFFDVQGSQSNLNDVNIQIIDSLCDADPALQPPGNDCDALGVQAPFDSNYDYCDSAGCVTYYAWVFINDDEHVGQFAPESQRQGTAAHELGHALNLTHESEGLACGKGPGGIDIPHSVMAYNCIDPATEVTGGSPGFDEGYVHDWDVCGVNHAYYDDSIGYAGCAPTCGGTNGGFEAGLTGWSQGTVTESITTVGVDNISSGNDAAPLEGAKMARLGNKQSSSGPDQPKGPNELFQVFTVKNPQLRCAYQLFTYDYFGFDEVTVELTVVATGDVIYSTRTGAFGPSGNLTLKRTGWRIINVDMRNYLGQQVKLQFTSEGTSDTLYATWGYVDSAEMQKSLDVVDTAATTVDGEPPMLDPASGQIVVPQSPGDDTLEISTPIKCPNGDDPTSVKAVLSKAPESPHPAPTIEISLTKGAGSIWSGTFNLPPAQPDATVWDLNYIVICPESPVPISVPVGKVILIDPSGFVTDAATSLPIQGATVWLQVFKDGEWSNANPFFLIDGQPTISPQINPQTTDSEGHYGWDVAAGRYRVVVTADGYIGQTSSEVDVPPPVLDLNLALQPVGSVTPTPSPTPPPSGQQTWGDVNCSGGPNPVDSLLILRDDAGISSASAQGDCPLLGTQLQVNGVSRFWGDLDCSGGPGGPIDSLKTLRYDAGLSVSKVDPSCPNAGSAVNLGAAATPTPTAAPTNTPTPVATATATPTATASAPATATPSPSPSPGPTIPVSPTTSCPGSGALFPIPIPDNAPGNPVVLTLSDPGGGVITDLDVCINIDHTWVGDLFVEVEHIDTGTTVTLIDQPGVPSIGVFGCPESDIRALLADEAASPVEDECNGGSPPTIEGAFRPNEPLSAFDGETFDGDWEIRIFDLEAEETGSVVGATFYWEE